MAVPMPSPFSSAIGSSTSTKGAAGAGRNGESPSGVETKEEGFGHHGSQNAPGTPLQLKQALARLERGGGTAASREECAVVGRAL